MSSLFKISILGLSLTLSGCYYDKEELLYPDSANCTVPTAPTFNANVLPLLNSRCNSCHGGVAPSGGINLTTYPEVMKYVNNGSLMGSINHASGYSAMPKNSGKLKTCEIETIQTWIDAGASNN